MSERTTWDPVDLGPVLDGQHVDKPPVTLRRDDGHALLYAGKVHSVAGEPESLKTWLLLVAAAQELGAGRAVLWVDFEDTPATLVSRLRALGCPDDEIRQHLTYVRPAEPPRGALDTLPLLLEHHALAVVDGVTEAMRLMGLDPDRGSGDAAAFMARLPRPLAATGAAVALIDHVTKAREGRGRWALGSQHKLAAIDGAAYVVELVKPFGHGQHGAAKVHVVKDRPGRVREHAAGKLAANLDLRSRTDGSVGVELQLPERQEHTADLWRPTTLMRRVSDALAAAGQPLTGRDITDRVQGRAQHIRTAIAALVDDGYVTVEPGANRKQLHHLQRPFLGDAPDDEAA